MKTLKNKIFWLLFTILTLFLFIVLLIFNYGNYNESLKRVERSLGIMNGVHNNEIPSDKPDSPMMFMDSSIYTVVFDGTNIINITSHSLNSNISEIKKVSEEILKKNKNNYIGNLYFNKYSYSFEGSILTISDNTFINQSLLKSLFSSLIIFIVLEGVIIFISLKLTKWITAPVDDAFKKQKDFIADASHELKTPLSVIMASSEAYEKDNNKKWIKNIQNESERMNKLILSLLDLAKSENIKREFTNIDLSKIVNKSILTFESLMYEKGINFSSEVQENISILGSAEEIKELMSILIDNAIEHSEKNGEIKVKLIKQKNNIELDVINKGKAIAKEDEERIFERFYKADKSRNRNNNRYGLGLAIAKNIVTSLNGTISAHSSNGFTTFKVIFKK